MPGDLPAVITTQLPKRADVRAGAVNVPESKPLILRSPPAGSDDVLRAVVLALMEMNTRLNALSVAVAKLSSQSMTTGQILEQLTRDLVRAVNELQQSNNAIINHLTV